MKYIKPEVEIVEIKQDDVITMSGVGDVGQDVPGEVIDEISNSGTDVW